MAKVDNLTIAKGYISEYKIGKLYGLKGKSRFNSLDELEQLECYKGKKGAQDGGCIYDCNTGNIHLMPVYKFKPVKKYSEIIGDTRKKIIEVFERKLTESFNENFDFNKGEGSKGNNIKTPYENENGNAIDSSLFKCISVKINGVCYDMMFNRIFLDNKTKTVNSITNCIQFRYVKKGAKFKYPCSWESKYEEIDKDKNYGYKNPSLANINNENDCSKIIDEFLNFINKHRSGVCNAQ